MVYDTADAFLKEPGFESLRRGEGGKSVFGVNKSIAWVVGFN